jgi:hypothetical protein
VAVGQSSLNMSRQVMQHLIGDKLPVIKTEKNEYLCQLSLLVHLVYIALI